VTKKGEMNGFFLNRGFREENGHICYIYHIVIYIRFQTGKRQTTDGR